MDDNLATLLSALLGAGVGGAATYLATRYALSRELENDRRLNYEDRRANSIDEALRAFQALGTQAFALREDQLTDLETRRKARASIMRAREVLSSVQHRVPEVAPFLDATAGTLQWQAIDDTIEMDPGGNAIEEIFRARASSESITAVLTAAAAAPLGGSKPETIRLPWKERLSGKRPVN